MVGKQAMCERAARRLVVSGLFVLWFALVAAVGQAAGDEKVDNSGGRFTAKTLLQVRLHEPHILDSAGGRDTAAEFEVYKATQAEFLKSDIVIIAALRSPRILGFEIIKNQADPVTWVANRLRVEFPANAEIMQASLSADNAVEAATLLNTIVDSYFLNVMDRERALRGLRLAEIEKAYAENEVLLRDRSEKLKQLAKELGIPEGEVLGRGRKQASEAAPAAHVSIDVEIRRMEIESLERLLNRLADERANLRIELRAQSRVAILMRAEPSDSKK